MAYVYPNFKSKAALKRALKAGDMVNISPNGLERLPNEGMAQVEGPHYPKPHTWYGQVQIKGGQVLSVK